MVKIISPNNSAIINHRQYKKVHNKQQSLNRIKNTYKKAIKQITNHQSQRRHTSYKCQK